MTCLLPSGSLVFCHGVKRVLDLSQPGVFFFQPPEIFEGRSNYHQDPVALCSLKLKV